MEEAETRRTELEGAALDRQRENGEIDGGWLQQGRVPVSACKNFTTAPGAAPGVAPGEMRSGGKSQCASTTTIDEVHDQTALYVPMPQVFSFAKSLITMVGLWISVLLHGRVTFAGRVR